LQNRLHVAFTEIGTAPQSWQSHHAEFLLTNEAKVNIDEQHSQKKRNESNENIKTSWILFSGIRLRKLYLLFLVFYVESTWVKYRTRNCSPGGFKVLPGFE